MNEALRAAADRLFCYSTNARVRRHGPAGYVDYQAFKPWLRDEFDFRCTYCLYRERWDPNGDRVFSVDHVLPTSSHPEQITDYDNLLYACCTCNSSRRAEPLPVDPVSEPLGNEILVIDSGVLIPLTKRGEELIHTCRLNRESLVDYRRRLQQMISMMLASPNQVAEAFLEEMLAFPDDLPDLESKRPPGGNSRPEGAANCYFAQRSRGELPGVY